jgi:hypothetical protein
VIRINDDLACIAPEDAAALRSSRPARLCAPDDVCACCSRIDAFAPSRIA